MTTTKFDQLRDELRPKDLHFRPECEHLKCGAKASWNEGFDAASALWAADVRELFEALKRIYDDPSVNCERTYPLDDTCFEVAIKACANFLAKHEEFK